MIISDFVSKLSVAVANLNKEDSILIENSKKIVKSLFDSKAEIFDLNSRKNCKKILSVEVGAGHDVIRPSIYKYFTELGYDVDFLLYGKKAEDRWNFFLKIKDIKYKEMVGDEAFILAVLALPIIKEYDYVLLNSNFVYTTNRFDTNWDYKKFLTYMRVPDRCKYGYLTIPPHPVIYKNKDKNIQFFTHLGSNGTPMLSVSFFGDVNITEKSDKNIFLLTGNINNGQKNHEMVLNSVRKLLQRNITNFELWINGQDMGNFSVPEELSEHVKYLGENRPETLFPILETADFIISGIDSEDSWQGLVYAQGTCSVGLMYAMGFGKVYICEDAFASGFGINDSNSILYKHGNLDKAIEKAINLSNKEYLNIQKNILDEAEKRYQKSLIDIKNVLELSRKKYKRRSNILGNLNLKKLLKYARLKMCYKIFPKRKNHYREKIERLWSK